MLAPACSPPDCSSPAPGLPLQHLRRSVFLGMGPVAFCQGNLPPLGPQSPLFALSQAFSFSPSSQLRPKEIGRLQHHPSNFSLFEIGIVRPHHPRENSWPGPPGGDGKPSPGSALCDSRPYLPDFGAPLGLSFQLGAPQQQPEPHNVMELPLSMFFSHSAV